MSAVNKELVPSLSIAGLVNIRAGVIERITKAHELMKEAELMLQRSPYEIKMPRFQLERSCNQRYSEHSLADDDCVEYARKMFDAVTWDYLLRESGLRSFMDQIARDAWHKQIAELETPPLTADTVEATFKAIHDSRGDMVERGVIECFKRLSWCYKTNKPFGFGKRLVLRFIRGEQTKNKLDDLLRFFHVMDKKPEPDHRHTVSSAIGYYCDAKTIETDYFSIRTFKNGNGHVTFKRPDLVEAMNSILARHYPGALSHNRHVA